MLKHLSIRKKYFILISLVCIISLAVVSIISYNISYKLLFKSTKAQFEMASQRYSNEIDDWIKSQANYLAYMSEDIKINSDYYNEERLKNMLKKKYENKGEDVLDYYIGFSDKRLISGSGWEPYAEYDCTERDWYIRAMEIEDTVYTLPYVDSDSQQMVITISKPLVMQGQTVGVIAVDITVDYLVNLVDGIKISDGSHAFLLDNQKNIITHPNTLFLPKEDLSFKIDQIIDGRLKALGDQIDNGNYHLIKLEDYDREEKYFIMSEIPSSKWILGFSIPTSEITDNLNVLLLGFVIAFLISIFISMIVILLLIHNMLKPIMHLTQVVKQFGKRKLDIRSYIDTNDEIGELSKSFNKMADTIQSYSQDLETKVEERTKELNEKNVKLQDSIEYAKMIQKTILPDGELIRQNLKDYFVIWNPRDIVGGDLYWMRKFKDGFIVMVGDCTGHGVPGALMTMAVNSILDRVVEDICHDDPARILGEVNRILGDSLRRGNAETSIQDGLDAGILFLSNESKILYAGDHLSLFVVQGEEIKEVKGDYKISKNSSDEKIFLNQEINFVPGMSFYLATDGMKDQIGGKKSLPFGKSRILATLKSIHQLPMEEQKNMIWSTYEAYKKGETPRDDVTMIGFKLF